MTRMSRFMSAAAVLGALLPGAAVAQSFDDVVRGELLTGWRSPDGAHIAALRITLAPGWKTYWRAPGDAGIPPHFDWQGSGNLASVGVSWPVPELFEQNGMRSVGYQGTVTLPLTFTPSDAGADIDISGTVEIGVCEEICIPMNLRVAAVLPSAAGDIDAEIAAAQADRPMTRAEAQVTKVTCRIEPISDGMRVSASIVMPPLGRDEAAVVEHMTTPVWVSEPDVRRQGEVLYASADMVPPDAAPFAVERNALRFTVIADGRAVDIRGCG